MGLAQCLTYKCGEDGSLTGLLLAFGVGDGCFLSLISYFFASGPRFFLGVLCTMYVFMSFVGLRNVVHAIYMSFHVGLGHLNIHNVPEMFCHRWRFCCRQAQKR